MRNRIHIYGRHGAARYGESRLGLESRGVASHGSQGLMRLGEARCDMATQARLDETWHGGDWLGMATQAVKGVGIVLLPNFNTSGEV